MNQEVVQLLDADLYGALPSNLPGLTSYWESVYHSDDDLTKSSSARYSTYLSFIRFTLRHIESEKRSNGGDGESLVTEGLVELTKGLSRGHVGTSHFIH